MPHGKLHSPKIVMLAFGETIKVLRKKIGLSQEKLASACDIDRAYMGQLERGHHMPRLDTIWRLLLVLRVTFPEFAQEFEKQFRRSARRRPEDSAR